MTIRTDYENNTNIISIKYDNIIITYGYKPIDMKLYINITVPDNIAPTDSATLPPLSYTFKAADTDVAPVAEVETAEETPEVDATEDESATDSEEKKEE